MAKPGVQVEDRIKKITELLKENKSKIRILGDSGYRSFSWVVYDCECTNCGSILLMTDKQLKITTSCGCIDGKNNGMFKIKVSEGD